MESITGRRIYSRYKQGYLKNVRVRIDDGKTIHIITNCNELIPFFGVELGLSLLNGFINCGQDKYTRRLRRGLKIEIFEI